METLKLSVTEKDALDTLLYYASKSAQIKKTRRRAVLLFALFMTVLCILFLTINKQFAIICAVISILILPFLQGYLKMRLKMHFRKSVQGDAYKALIGSEHTTQFYENDMHVKSATAETKYAHEGFEYISETADYFFIKLKAATLLCFPKNQVTDVGELKSYFQKLCAKQNIAYLGEQNWSWK